MGGGRTADDDELPSGDRDKAYTVTHMQYAIILNAVIFSDHIIIIERAAG